VWIVKRGGVLVGPFGCEVCVGVQRVSHPFGDWPGLLGGWSLVFLEGLGSSGGLYVGVGLEGEGGGWFSFSVCLWFGGHALAGVCLIGCACVW
jgi:hypothetical protein